MTHRHRLLASVLPLLAACAHDDVTYPSLAPRAVEQVDLAEPTSAPTPPVAADPALDAAVARAVTAQVAAARSFDRTATAVERQARAARSRAAGSPRWLEAQVALAGLDEARAAHGATVSALEDLAAQRAATLAEPYPPLEAALTQARTAAAAQTRRADAIAALLPAS